ncbi:hypothetical protein AUEXF2481DRAFT_63325 [Aureobasidium subglaciale EXF-2481]|uniref:ML-like domain-containing protein n=1 Tax=Aureobasidium subglaciale (strain EXF-2481) TaxID=1043005 RepID=A0A074YJ21_AURSE|nr:uncharacterized protein AUEXF2481DRAFT_63325 [Aureobasidium subglaciale EXF-2481]KEQ97803.1 hypothetical protein AUEXF2481DRAFT_63325 [Aureobasidium subglaciale EXF-2481]
MRLPPLQSALAVGVAALSALPSHVSAAFINFDNCLDQNIRNSNPLHLQFVPLFVDVRFNTSASSHNLNLTIYGNVSGQATQGSYPPPDDPLWQNADDSFGKIVDISPSNNRYSTLFQRYQVLTFDAYEAEPSRFCNSTLNSECPLTPSFFANASNPYELSAFTVSHDFYSPYAFATIATTISAKSGDAGAPDIACISANITPALGHTLSGLLTYLPVAILILVAIATAAAAIYSPWGSTDPFKWTTNYGRDQDLLRLVTPGFGDCLQYIQFIFLTGALSLNYPGYYAPVTKQASWSALLFNTSYVSHGQGTMSLQDGIYITNGTYGMTRMSQLVGMTAVRDIWACMAVWLLVVSVAAVLLCQLAFLVRWVLRLLSNTQEEDLRQKNTPLSGGMVVRILFNYFLLPVVAISMFQLIVARRSPPSVVAMAVILLLSIIALALWILNLIFRTKPRAYLFDDLPTVLLYGPLYNTYSDEAAPFALVPAILTFIRGIAIGAVQPSGIAQLVIMAICEVILILTLHAFRPFHSPTHMNAYHTFFASARLATVLLMVAFVPSLGVTEAPKGWIGYAILLIHGIVLIFGFFMNALQTLLEVFARMAGAGGDPQHGAQRGGLISFGWRQLRKRQPGRQANRPGSMMSDAAILANDSDAKSLNLMGGRSRSMSASSQMMLSQHLPDNRASGGFDQFAQSEYGYTPTVETPTTPYSAVPQSSGTAAVLANPGKRPVLGIKTEQPLSDPYYRAPRPRRNTNDPYTPGARSRHSTSGDWNRLPYLDSPDHTLAVDDLGEGSSVAPPYLRTQHRGASDPDLADLTPRERTDYAVREVDYYYGVRGPALSNAPARKLKTGPADPVGPVSSATTWFQRLVGGKRKDQGKGFEVVRSSRVPGNMTREPIEDEEGQELQTSPPMNYLPYKDSPDPQSAAGARRSYSPEGYGDMGSRLGGTWNNMEVEESDTESEISDIRPSSPPYLRPISRAGSINFDQVDHPVRAPSSAAAKDYFPTSPPPRHLFHVGNSGRPTSMGTVQQRMTGDSVFQSAGVGEGSTAEIVTSDRTMSMESRYAPR